MSCFVPVCRIHVHFCASHVCLCSLRCLCLWARGGMGVRKAAECVEHLRFFDVCLCTVLYGCVWAVRIKQRAHHIENRHIVGWQAHTKGFSSRSLLLLSLYLSLVLSKRSHWAGSVYFDLAFFHISTCVFFPPLSLEFCFLSFTQYFTGYIL